MKLHPLTLDPRLAGEVERWHTWTTLCRQNVSAHSWQALRLLLAVCPEAPRHLMIEVAFHDIGERVSGDMPYPGKSLVEGLKPRLDAVESSARLAMSLPWGVPPPRQLEPEEEAILKLVDYLEMLEHALHELSLGNLHMRLVYMRCVRAVEDAAGRCPHHVQDKLDWYMARRIKMQREIGLDVDVEEGQQEEDGEDDTAVEQGEQK
jgi:HD containing hydrolase-like enzyme